MFSENARKNRQTREPKSMEVYKSLGFSKNLSLKIDFMTLGGESRQSEYPAFDFPTCQLYFDSN